MTITQYRLFVVATFFSFLFSYSVDFFWQRDLVLFVSDFSESLLDMSLLRRNVFVAFFVVMSLMAIYSFVGLLRLQSNARYYFIAMLVFTIPINLLLSISVDSSLSRISYDIGLIMSGVLVVLIFTDPIKYYFR